MSVILPLAFLVGMFDCGQTLPEDFVCPDSDIPGLVASPSTILIRERQPSSFAAQVVASECPIDCKVRNQWLATDVPQWSNLANEWCEVQQGYKRGRDPSCQVGHKKCSVPDHWEKTPDAAADWERKMFPLRIEREREVKGSICECLASQIRQIAVQAAATTPMAAPPAGPAILCYGPTDCPAGLCQNNVCVTQASEAGAMTRAGAAPADSADAVARAHAVRRVFENVDVLLRKAHDFAAAEATFVGNGVGVGGGELGGNRSTMEDGWTRLGQSTSSFKGLVDLIDADVQNARKKFVVNHGSLYYAKELGRAHDALQRAMVEFQTGQSGMTRATPAGGNTMDTFLPKGWSQFECGECYAAAADRLSAAVSDAVATTLPALDPGGALPQYGAADPKPPPPKKKP